MKKGKEVLLLPGGKESEGTGKEEKGENLHTSPFTPGRV